MEKSIEELKKENLSLLQRIGGYKVQNKRYRESVEELTANLRNLGIKYEELKTKYDKIIALPWYKRIFGF